MIQRLFCYNKHVKTVLLIARHYSTGISTSQQNRSRMRQIQLLEYSAVLITAEYNYFKCEILGCIVSDIKRIEQSEDIWEQGSKENILTKEGWSNRRMEEVAQWEAS
jgi:hypothetical protein